jgi:protein required for attachment to host cells
MANTWVLVADSSAAHIYSTRTVRGPLKLVESHAHPESRAKATEVYADGPGRVHDRFGPGRHAVEGRVDLHAEEAQRFARELAERLAAGHHEQSFQRLIIMAPPAFLGALRNALPKPVAATVTAEVAKNLVGQDAAAIEGYLP